MDVDADDAKAKAKVSCLPIQAAERLRCIICSRLRHVWGVQRRLQRSVPVTPCDLGAREAATFVSGRVVHGAVLYSACLLSRACAADGDDDSRSPAFFFFRRNLLSRSN